MIYFKKNMKECVIKIFNILYDFIEYYMKNYRVLNLINLATINLVCQY